MDTIKKKVQLLSSITSIENEVKNIGADISTIPIFTNKGKIIPLKIYDLVPPAANIIKQEMLSAGGDAIVHRHAINCKVETSDALLLGTAKHYFILKDKLFHMPYWGLKEIGQEIFNIVTNLLKTLEPIKTPHGILKFDKPLIMGIINTTPDSFFSDSRKQSIEAIVQTAKQMVENGADILDIGGESTRPGAEPVSLEEEINRVIPAIKAIRKELGEKIIISIDTYKSQVAKLAIDAGADIINDISGLQFDKEMVKIAQTLSVPVVIMHIKGTPRNMQKNPQYENFIKELHQYFIERMEYAISNGIEEKNIILDPGIGFGKRLEDNVAIFNQIEGFLMYGRPILIGASRKSMIGMILQGIPPHERLEGTLALTALAVDRGAHIIRVHDVKENRKVADLTYYIRRRR